MQVSQREPPAGDPRGQGPGVPCPGVREDWGGADRVLPAHGRPGSRGHRYWLPGAGVSSRAVQRRGAMEGHGTGQVAPVLGTCRCRALRAGQLEGLSSLQAARRRRAVVWQGIRRHEGRPRGGLLGPAGPFEAGSHRPGTSSTRTSSTRSSRGGNGARRPAQGLQRGPRSPHGADPDAGLSRHASVRSSETSPSAERPECPSWAPPSPNPVFAASRVISLFKEWQETGGRGNSHPLFQEAGKELNVVLSSISSTVPGEFTQMGIPLIATDLVDHLVLPRHAEEEFYRVFALSGSERSLPILSSLLSIELTPTYHTVRAWETPVTKTRRAGRRGCLHGRDRHRARCRRRALLVRPRACTETPGHAVPDPRAARRQSPRAR